MPRILALAVVSLSAAFPLGNAGPFFRVDYENEVKLAQAAPDHQFFTLQVGLEKAELTPLELGTEKWAILTHRGIGDWEFTIDLYCVPVAVAKAHETPAKLWAAIREGKAEHTKYAFEASKVVAKHREHSTVRIRSVVTLDEKGKMSVTTTTVEHAPEPRKISRLMLIGTFTALALAVGGAWLWRRAHPSA